MSERSPHRRRAHRVLLALVLELAACDRSEPAATAPAPPADPWALESRSGDPRWAAGQAAFAACASCHLADGGGRTDGTVPRLAGQHAAIITRRLQALRDGTRELPVMWPFARALSDADVELIAGYVAGLPKPSRVEIGTSTGQRTIEGAALFTQRCVACHGPRGEGNPALGAPRLCGQHFGYLVRRLVEMSDLDRADVDPRMRALAVALTDADRLAVADLLSRLDCDDGGAPP